MHLYFYDNMVSGAERFGGNDITEMEDEIFELLDVIMISEHDPDYWKILDEENADFDEGDF